MLDSCLTGVPAMAKAIFTATGKRQDDAPLYSGISVL